ncbi:methyltransferase [Mesobacillus zeae]|uniref:Methyltransferase n=1 Tax=Mesobacillus zeae TaxID=1917180 RepID=A0A398BD07_9BACI|nr:methyltransferase [Mesobacillus zeae]RID87494.1 methyltransferase [Mesobacillus zeae]
MEENRYDEMLNIWTGGSQDGFYSSFHYHRYEPTPYADLEKLFEQYQLKESDTVIDFGCGKGRLAFLLHYMFRASVLGVEMNEEFCQDAMENLEHYSRKVKEGEDKITFYCGLAEEFEIGPKDNRFYFFNPFSVQIFTKVINNILISLEKEPREVHLILYYPSEDYIYYLESQTSFQLWKEIELPSLNDRNSDERFLIYRLVY